MNNKKVYQHLWCPPIDQSGDGADSGSPQPEGAGRIRAAVSSRSRRDSRAIVSADPELKKAVHERLPRSPRSASAGRDYAREMASFKITYLQTFQNKLAGDGPKPDEEVTADRYEDADEWFEFLRDGDDVSHGPFLRIRKSVVERIERIERIES